MTRPEILESYTADYTTQIHHAQRSDGQWFTRYQNRDPRYGYRWGAWRKSVAPSGGRSTGRTARLPKD